MSLSINGARLRSDIESLRAIGRTATGGVSRTSYSAADQRARDWYADRCTEAGLTLQVDGLGNLTASGPGSATGRPAVWTGSHVDSVPDGGHLDGALGAVAALECVRRLAEEDVPLARPVVAAVFADEEGNYSRRLGSAGLVKGYTVAELEAMVGRDDDRLVDRLADWGWSTEAAARTRLPPGHIHSFVELHIEQGPHLEASGVDIGVVTTIVGVGSARVEFTGQADHAGTTPLPARRDALLGAAEFITAVRRIATDAGDRAVATCGRVTVTPGGSNVVPGSATLLLDFRAPDTAQLRALADALEREANDVAQRHRLDVAYRRGVVVDPVPLDAEIRGIIADSADALGLSRTELPSGAGHDAANLAEITPTAMVFVPSVAGRSHSPLEDTRWSDIENGANVLLRTVLALAG